MTLSNDGRLMAAGHDDGKITLRDVRTGEEKAAFAAHSQYVLSLGFSPDDAILASGGYDHAVKLWKLPAK